VACAAVASGESQVVTLNPVSLTRPAAGLSRERERRRHPFPEVTQARYGGCFTTKSVAMDGRFWTRRRAATERVIATLDTDAITDRSQK